VAVTWAHHAIVAGDRDGVILGLMFTIGLGAIFTGFQGLEYVEAAFSISDGVYGSTFFLSNRIPRVSCTCRITFSCCLFIPTN
jgi:cytochrome c oxidase subunit 3